MVNTQHLTKLVEITSYSHEAVFKQWNLPLPVTYRIRTVNGLSWTTTQHCRFPFQLYTHLLLWDIARLQTGRRLCPEHF